MLYSTPEYFLLLATTIFFSALSPAQSLRFWILLVASLVFYAWAGLLDTLIFLFVVTASWLSAWASHRIPRYRDLWLTIGITLLSTHLFVWKYAEWILNSLRIPSFHFPLPVGISFFTLQGIAYLIDLRRREAAFIPLREYSLFKSFFPQLVAGPIVRVHQLLPQLEKLPRPTLADIGAGLPLFIQGFVKKLIVADRLAPFADRAFDNPSLYSRTALLQAVLAYSLQIWGDFSGYTDMGRGSARMLGIHLPENFLSPYAARTPSEFWKRWHITLSQWIRDYIYIPMGGGKGSATRATAVALATMAISGLWHGAQSTFLLWGLYHGALLVFERILGKLDPLRKIRALLGSTLDSIALGVMMFSLTSFGWILFRSPDLNRFIQMIRSLASPLGSQSEPSLSRNLTLGLLFCASHHALSYRSLREGARPLALRFALSWNRRFQRIQMSPALGFACGSLIALVLLIALLLRPWGDAQSFIYFHF